jgi:hypothetical protein
MTLIGLPLAMAKPPTNDELLHMKLKYFNKWSVTSDEYRYKKTITRYSLRNRTIAGDYFIDRNSLCCFHQIFNIDQHGRII